MWPILFPLTMFNILGHPYRSAYNKPHFIDLLTIIIIIIVVNTRMSIQMGSVVLGLHPFSKKILQKDMYIYLTLG